MSALTICAASDGRVIAMPGGDVLCRQPTPLSALSWAVCIQWWVDRVPRAAKYDAVLIQPGWDEDAAVGYIIDINDTRGRVSAGEHTPEFSALADVLLHALKLRDQSPDPGHAPLNPISSAQACAGEIAIAAPGRVHAPGTVR